MSDSCASAYQVYLLRIWLERSGEPGQEAVWRFSLGGIFARRRQGFSSLEALMKYLEEQIRQPGKDCRDEAAS